jgi:hypothetical protein
MTRIIFIPTRTADGRQIVLQAVALTAGERLRRLGGRFGLRQP